MCELGLSAKCLYLENFQLYNQFSVEVQRTSTDELYAGYHGNKIVKYGNHAPPAVVFV